MTVCLDASVVCAALFQEPHAAAAGALLAGENPLLAPDLIHAEVANVIWKRHQRKEIDAAEATAIMTDFLALPIEITPSEELVESALLLALHTERTVYDSLYLALAIEAKCVLVTGDRRLVNAMSATPLAPHLSWIGDNRWLPTED